MPVDLAHLQALTSACKDATDDHIWTLRDDPGCLPKASVVQKSIALSYSKVSSVTGLTRMVSTMLCDLGFREAHVSTAT